jgi:hypothetical protein
LCWTRVCCFDAVAKDPLFLQASRDINTNKYIHMFDSGGEQIKGPLFVLTGTPSPHPVNVKIAYEICKCNYSYM